MNLDDLERIFWDIHEEDGYCCIDLALKGEE